MIKSHSAAFIAGKLPCPAFTLIDVGCSGGIAEGWSAFGDKFRAYGFDPALEEIRRLSAQERRPFVRYYPAFVGLPLEHPLRARYQLLKSSWQRLSAAHALAYAAGEPPSPVGTITEWRQEYIPQYDGPMFGDVELEGRPPSSATVEQSGMSSPQLSSGDAISDEMEANLWRSVELADERRPLVLSDFVIQNNIDDIDFVKIDIDGMDYTVLYDLAPLWSSRKILGAMLEVNFEGDYSPHHHTFHNTDRYMRRHGFDLFGLTTRPYSSAALPSPFLYKYPAQSRSGRPLQGDALYIRDFAWRTTETDSEDFSTEKLARLVALFCLFDLHDQAAETVIRFRERISKIIDVNGLLDRLAAEVQSELGCPLSYDEYMASFARRDTNFYNFEHRETKPRS